MLVSSKFLPTLSKRGSHCALRLSELLLRALTLVSFAPRANWDKGPLLKKKDMDDMVKTSL